MKNMPERCAEQLGWQEEYGLPGQETQEERTARLVESITEIISAHDAELSREEVGLLEDVCWELEERV